MDIIQAQGELAGAVATKQKEIDSLNLASTILSETFTAEFTARDQALSEMSATYKKLDDEKNARTQDVATLTSEKASVQTALEAEQTAHAETQAKVDALTIETNDKATAIEAKDAIIADLQAQVAKIADPVQTVDSTSVPMAEVPV